MPFNFYIITVFTSGWIATKRFGSILSAIRMTKFPTFLAEQVSPTNALIHGNSKK